MQDAVDKLEPISVEIMVVDCKDILDPYIKVKLEMNDDSSDKSIKVLMKEDKKWKHNGYVKEIDAVNLMQYEFLDKKIMYKKKNTEWVTSIECFYKIQITCTGVLLKSTNRPSTNNALG